MAVCSLDVEVVACNQCFFMDFDLFVVMQGGKRNNLPSNLFLGSW